MKILILKPSSLGDVIHALPVLRLLRQHLPHSEIFWWIDSGLAPLIADDPDLTGLIPFERKRWVRPQHWPEMIRSILAMRRHAFDWVIDLQGLARSGAFAWLANGKLLVGLDEAREGARGFYDLVARRENFHTHAVDWYLQVLPLLGAPIHKNFTWLPERPASAAAVDAKWPAADARWIALQPGARWLNKRWPAEHFAALARLLAAELPAVRFAVLGGPDDAALAEIVSRGAPDRCVNLAGRTSLPEMIEWTRRCELMITNDTGPMHVAVALQKKVIAMFGPTTPERTGPYGQLDRVLRMSLPCAPCMKSNCAWPQPLECLTTIRPEAVFRRALTELRPRP